MNTWLFNSTPLTPHGFCLLWEPWLIWSSAVGDAGTALAYFGIPIALAKFASHRSDLVFKPVFWLFAVFILLCGVTHWLDLITIWVPAYHLQTLSKLATAAVSAATAIALWRMLPTMLALPSPIRMQMANEALLASQAELRALNASLEQKVLERTTELAEREARMRELLETLQLGAFMARDPNGTIRFWSEGCTRLYGWTAAEAVGRNSHHLLRTVFPVPLTEIEAAVGCEGAWTGDLHHRSRDGHEVIVTARTVLRSDAAGAPAVVLESLVDITEVRRAERERQRADTLLRGIIASAPGLIYAKDREGRLILANAAVTTLLGKPWDELKGRTDLEYLEDRLQADTIVANDRRIMDEGLTEEVEELAGTESGRPRVWLSTKTPLRGADGQVEGLVGVSMEITERKRTEERLRLMVHELNHRVKNTMATIQALAVQTLGGSNPGGLTALDSRLQALAMAHDVLTRENWQGAGFDDVVDAALEVHGGRTSKRFRVSGPPIRLRPPAALALAMAFHELATNALKYGSLSPVAPEGWVELRWRINDGRLHLTWTERGGPPVVRPARRGFGTRLLERNLTQELQAEITLEYGSEGVTCTVDAPMNAIVSVNGEVSFPNVGFARR